MDDAADFFQRRVGVQAERDQSGFERAPALVVPERGAARVERGGAGGDGCSTAAGSAGASSGSFGASRFISWVCSTRMRRCCSAIFSTLSFSSRLSASMVRCPSALTTASAVNWANAAITCTSSGA